jgi:hypothetical protein
VVSIQSIFAQASNEPSGNADDGDIESEVQPCKICGTPTDIQCSGCAAVFYCSEACQVRLSLLRVIMSYINVVHFLQTADWIAGHHRLCEILANNGGTRDFYIYTVKTFIL